MKISAQQESREEVVRQMSECDNVKSAIMSHCGGINELSRTRVVGNEKKTIQARLSYYDILIWTAQDIIWKKEKR